jgi:hypothetical protein
MSLSQQDGVPHLANHKDPLRSDLDYQLNDGGIADRGDGGVSRNGGVFAGRPRVTGAPRSRRT